MWCESVSRWHIKLIYLLNLSEMQKSDWSATSVTTRKTKNFETSTTRCCQNVYVDAIIILAYFSLQWKIAHDTLVLKFIPKCFCRIYWSWFIMSTWSRVWGMSRKATDFVSFPCFSLQLYVLDFLLNVVFGNRFDYPQLHVFVSALLAARACHPLCRRFLKISTRQNYSVLEGKHASSIRFQTVAAKEYIAHILPFSTCFPHLIGMGWGVDV